MWSFLPTEVQFSLNLVLEKTIFTHRQKTPVECLT
jgi:hypothetical protein